MINIDQRLIDCIHVPMKMLSCREGRTPFFPFYKQSYQRPFDCVSMAPTLSANKKREMPIEMPQNIYATYTGYSPEKYFHFLFSSHLSSVYLLSTCPLYLLTHVVFLPLLVSKIRAHGICQPGWDRPRTRGCLDALRQLRAEGGTVAWNFGF